MYFWGQFYTYNLHARVFREDARARRRCADPRGDPGVVQTLSVVFSVLGGLSPQVTQFLEN